jgi:hypothetical protein
MLVDARNKNTNDSLAGISTLFKIFFSNSALRGTGPLRMVMTYIPLDAT